MQEAPGGAEMAIANGLIALKAGDHPGAEAWFGRAHRIVPDDPTSSLLLASSLSRNAPAHAEKLLRGVLHRHPSSGAARIALAAIRLALGDTGDAAALLHTHLSNAAPPADTSFPALASAITSRAGYHGWIGVDCDGRISCPADCVSRIDFKLDGRAFRLRAEPGILPDGWRIATTLTATIGGKDLLGSPVDLLTRSAASGVVEIDAIGDLRGWAWMVADPDAAPRLRVSTRGGKPILAVTATDGRAIPDVSDGVARPRLFHIPSTQLPPGGLIRVTGPDGLDLLGSPLCIASEQNAAVTAARDIAARLTPGTDASGKSARAIDLMRPLPVSLLPPLAARLQPLRTGVPKRRPVDIIIPLFRGADDLLLCLDCVLRELPSGTRVVLVDDGSRDQALRAVLKSLHDSRITILRHKQNRGFPAAANTGMQYAIAATDGPRDVILLNADTLVSAGWLEGLSRTAYARADIGSVTPMTNDGTLTSYVGACNEGVNDRAGADQLGADFLAADAGTLVELPTAVGFCMFIRHDCLAQAGLFREDVFAQGYGEETDWSLRARHLGWRHVAAGSAFVIHKGGASFGPAGRALRVRNMAILERLHPGANAALTAFIEDDPLAEIRYHADERRWRRGAAENGAVILITHASGGGVERVVLERATSWQARGVRAIIVRPHGIWPPEEGAARRCSLSDGDVPYTDLIFDPGAGLDALAAFLEVDRPQAVELHQMMGHDEALGGLAARLGVPLDIHVHDYAMVCPRVTLCSRPGRYCGEPEAVEICDDCVAMYGDRLHEGLGVAVLRGRSANLMSQARSVHTASAESARRIGRYFPVAGKVIISPREDDPPYSTLHPHGPARRICVPGAIGDDKGYGVLLACARDAAKRQLDLHFTVVGHTSNDAMLMETGRVFVTGRYSEDEAADLIAAQRPDLGFLPSVWPETWCFSLTLLWRAGLWPIVFDLGAQAERVTARGIGSVLPAGLPAARINDFLMTAKLHAA